MHSSSNIERAFYHLRWLLPEAEQQKLTEMYERLDKDSLSIEAVLPVCNIDLYPSDHSEWPSDAYEVSSYYENTDTNECLRTSEEVEERISDLEDKISEIEDQLSELEELPKLSNKQKEKQDNLQDELKDAEEQKYRWEKALEDPKYDEVLWNRVWAPREDVDEELAFRTGFAVLTITEDFAGHSSGDQYIGLTCCGMDRTPQLVAYCALKYQQVDPEWIKYFTSRQEWKYLEYVVGRQVAREVAQALEVEDRLYPEGETDE